MSNIKIPVNIINLNAKEQELFEGAHSIIEGEPKLVLHLECIERAMTVASLLVLTCPLSLIERSLRAIHHVQGLYIHHLPPFL